MMHPTALATPLAATIGTAVIAAAVDPATVGQAILGAIIVVGYLVQHRSACTTKREVEQTAQAVSEVHVMVDGRMSEALVEIHVLKERLDAKDAVIASQAEQVAAALPATRRP